jgi:hypothetical protein
MSNPISTVICWLVLVALTAWTLWMLGAMVYYGTFIVESQEYPRGGEAQLGALIGFLYALPGLLALTTVAWFFRRTVPRLVSYAPGAILFFACAYFGYLRFLVGSVAPQ